MSKLVRAYACLCFDTKQRVVTHWDVLSEPGEQATMFDGKIYATITSSAGVDYAEAEVRVLKVMADWMPGVERGHRIEPGPGGEDQASIRQALALRDWAVGTRALMATHADESDVKNFAILTLGGMKEPWDKLELVLYRKDAAKTTGEVCAELKEKVAVLTEENGRLRDQNRALEVQLAEASR